MSVVTDMNTLSRWIANVWQMFTKAENSLEDFNNTFVELACQIVMESSIETFVARKLVLTTIISWRKNDSLDRLVLSTMHFLSGLTIIKICLWTFLSCTLKAFVELYVLRKILVQITSLLRPSNLILVKRRLLELEYL